MIRDDAAARAFVRAHAALAAPPLVPEIALHLAQDAFPLWHATEAWLAARGVEPPFWAFAWPGGQALARWVLDHPDEVRGRAVLDVAAGSGLCGLAAARAGATRVVLVDTDPLATAAAALNAAANGLADRVAVETGDATALESSADVVLAGDVCYARAMAEPLLAWLRDRAARGARVLLGDPGRAYAPEGLEALAAYDVAVPEALEGTVARRARVLRVA